MNEKNLAKKSERASLRLPQNIKSMLDEAQQNTGLDRSEIISICIETGIAGVVEREAEKRLREAQASLERIKARRGEVDEKGRSESHGPIQRIAKNAKN